ncbi:MAG: molybdopterin molybdotransferase MoeA [Desulfurococcales archaeon]|nr:molybdopterin molybdotransferase MoeA [Desulfurococcales archaeon]
MPRFWGKLVRIKDALEKAVNTIKLDVNIVEESIWHATGLILARDLYSPMDLPRFNRSAVDGYAVRSIDVAGASPTNPVVLKYKGIIETGDPPDKYGIISPGEAIEVLTGSPIPPGADAVVMYEDTVRKEDEIHILRPVSPWTNITRQGEDIGKNQLMFRKGTILKPWHLALASAVGLSKLPVYERVQVGVVSIGSELVEPGKPLYGGKVYLSTDVMVKQLIEQLGFTTTKYYGVVPDDLDRVSKAISKALAENHIVVTIGGTSVSDKDLIPMLVERRGKWIIRGIALRPGRTTGVAVIDKKPLFTLSGNPIAAWVGFEAFMKPLLHLWLGAQPEPYPAIRARLSRRIVNPVGYRSYVRVLVRKEYNTYYVEPYRVKGSSIISSLARTHGFIVVEEDLEGIEAGEEVEVFLLNPPNIV